MTKEEIQAIFDRLKQQLEECEQLFLNLVDYVESHQKEDGEDK